MPAKAAVGVSRDCCVNAKELLDSESGGVSRNLSGTADDSSPVSKHFEAGFCFFTDKPGGTV